MVTFTRRWRKACKICRFTEIRSPKLSSPENIFHEYRLLDIRFIPYIYIFSVETFKKEILCQVSSHLNFGSKNFLLIISRRKQ